MPDELYILARRVLLDALEALGDHIDATVLVGAQAIYLHTGQADIAVAEYTTDLAFDPARLDEIPPLEQALIDADFYSTEAAVGVWNTRCPTEEDPEYEVQVDLLVPSAVSPGKGRRPARLPGHDSNAARKVDGLEGILVDNDLRAIGSLDPDADTRAIDVAVGGPAGLVIAKLHKISERKGTGRSNDKDALDVLRVLRAIGTDELAHRWTAILDDVRSNAAGTLGLELLGELFGTRASEGADMAVRATGELMDADEVRQSCVILAGDLLRALGLER